MAENWAKILAMVDKSDLEILENSIRNEVNGRKTEEINTRLKDMEQEYMQVSAKVEDLREVIKLNKMMNQKLSSKLFELRILTILEERRENIRQESLAEEIKMRSSINEREKKFEEAIKQMKRTVPECIKLDSLKAINNVLTFKLENLNAQVASGIEKFTTFKAYQQKQFTKSIVDFVANVQDFKKNQWLEKEIKKVQELLDGRCLDAYKENSRPKVMDKAFKGVEEKTLATKDKIIFPEFQNFSFEDNSKPTSYVTASPFLESLLSRDILVLDSSYSTSQEKSRPKENLIENPASSKQATSTSILSKKEKSLDIETKSVRFNENISTFKKPTRPPIISQNKDHGDKFKVLENITLPSQSTSGQNKSGSKPNSSNRFANPGKYASVLDVCLKTLKKDKAATNEKLESSFKKAKIDTSFSPNNFAKIELEEKSFNFGLTLSPKNQTAVESMNIDENNLYPSDTMFFDTNKDFNIF